MAHVEQLKWYLVGGMCSLLPYSPYSVIILYTVFNHFSISFIIYIFFNLVTGSGINKLDQMVDDTSMSSPYML